MKLQVHANAFRSTKSYTNKFTLYAFDCTLLDLDFLSGFDKITKLNFDIVDNCQQCFPSLPPLPNLSLLDLTCIKGRNHLKSFPNLTNGLKVFRFLGDEYNMDKAYNDETIGRVLDWLLLSSSDTLEEIKFVDVEVTRVPHQIASFKALRKLWLYNNNISTIKSGAFSFSVPVYHLNIAKNGIKEIEPGAFQGDFKDAKVYIHNNELTRFEESVFGPILRQMASGNGYINLRYDDAGNPIDCSDESICHLTWLRNYEVDVKFWLKCSNGTSFKDLQPDGFNHCP